MFYINLGTLLIKLKERKLPNNFLFCQLIILSYVTVLDTTVLRKFEVKECVTPEEECRILRRMIEVRMFLSYLAVMMVYNQS